MNDKTKERLAQLQELIKQKEEIEKKIEAILSPEKEVVLPPNFSMNAEVFNVVKDTGSTGIAKPSILHSLQVKYPDYRIDRKKVASALAYLKNTKKQVEIIERGMYKVANTS